MSRVADRVELRLEFDRHPEVTEAAARYAVALYHPLASAVGSVAWSPSPAFSYHGLTFRRDQVLQLEVDCSRPRLVKM